MARAEFLVALLLFLLPLCSLADEGGGDGRLYCIIGAGPGGLQMGYFLHRAGRDYVVFEKNSTAGSFFLHYPRHRALLSINKRNTGSSNKEFNFRHDWNTLISDDESLQMRHYSRKYLPHADDYVRYLQDYAERQGLRVQYNTEITRVDRQGDTFLLTDHSGSTYHCQVLIVSTGIWVPNIPDITGIEHTMGYESMSINPEDFEDKIVLILGRGNAGFETADNIVGHTAYIHMASRSRIKMAYQTHYVGDLRAINNQLVDTYQLKSLDGQFEADFEDASLLDGQAVINKADDGRLFLGTPTDFEVSDNALFRHHYDAIIRCLGFKFDFSIFNGSARPEFAPAGRNKFPHINPYYEAVNIPGMYFAGTATHSLDFKKSAGGFIHGFRYTARALFHHLQWKYHGIPWPSVTLPVTDLLNYLLKRINEASGLYQMFGILADVILLKDKHTVEYLEEVPVQGLPVFREMTGHKISGFILWNFEYGKGYSGPGEDVLREDRAIGDAEQGDKSNFLHPVLYYYKDAPRRGSSWNSGSFPLSDRYHHVVEDFLTDWTARNSHIIPVRRFLESIFNTDLREFFAETCFELILTHGDDVPLSCKQHYLQGLGMSSSDGVVDFGPSESFSLL